MSDFLKLSEGEYYSKMTEIHAVFDRLIKQFNLDNKTIFLDPPYFRDDNSRARLLGDKISFNQKFLKELSLPDIERIMSHEFQHAINYQEYDGGRFADNPKQEDNPYLFIFHTDFLELYKRMEIYYHEKKSTYPFVKNVFLPATWNERGNKVTHNYADPDEVLALLRGYQVLLQQRESGDSVTTHPYDFSDVFDAGNNDLRFLDREYRRKLAQEVIEQKPEVFPEKKRAIQFNFRASTRE